MTITGTETCPDLPPGSSWSHTFAVTGTYSYHDRVNPDHTGTVVVVGTAAGQVDNVAYAMHDVSITVAGFDPAGVVIAPHDVVRWTNTDVTTHTVVGGEYKPHYYVYLPLVLRQSP